MDWLWHWYTILGILLWLCWPEFKEKYMVITVKEALEQRYDNSEVDALVEKIDIFLGSVEAESAGLDLDEVDVFSRNYITRLYTDAGWIVRWDTSRDGSAVIWLKPQE